MNHGSEGGGWKMWIPMIVCCTVMLGFFLLTGVGLLSLR